MQITRTTPLRRMILQFLHIFLTDALTFIGSSPITAALSAQLSAASVVAQVGFLHQVNRVCLAT